MSAELLAQAHLAGAGWGGFADAPELVGHRENAVFFARLTDTRPVALRLHRKGYLPDEAIIEEMRFYEMLADAGFACPWPYRTDNDGMLHHLPDGATRATIIQWIDAIPLSDIDETVLPLAERFKAVGALLADLHLTADTVLPPPVARPAWDRDALTGPNGLWGDCIDDPALSEEHKALLRDARAAARDRLGSIPSTETGLIHGDPLPDNILSKNGTLYLIDFDDCGAGYRMYDLATALIGIRDEALRHQAADALCEGYRAAGGPLTQRAFADLPLFFMLRAHASAAWTLTRCTAGDPRRALYRKRALDLSQAFMAHA